VRLFETVDEGVFDDVVQQVFERCNAVREDALISLLVEQRFAKLARCLRNCHLSSVC